MLKESEQVPVKVSWSIHLKKPKLSWDRKGSSPFNWLKDRKKVVIHTEIA